MRSTNLWPCRSSSNCSGVSFSPARSARTANRSVDIGSDTFFSPVALIVAGEGITAAFSSPMTRSLPHRQQPESVSEMTVTESAQSSVPA
jgi:hypothetical protein